MALVVTSVTLGSVTEALMVAFGEDSVTTGCVTFCVDAGVSVGSVVTSPWGVVSELPVT